MSRFIKISSLLFVLILGMGLSGCGSGADKETAKEERRAEEPKSSIESNQKSSQNKAKEAAVTEKSTGKPPEKISSNKTEASDQPTKNAAPVEESSTSQSVEEQKPIDKQTEVTAAPQAKSADRQKSASAPKPVTTKKAPTPSVKPVESVNLSIKGPKDVGTILSAYKVEYEDGDTVLDVLIKGAKITGENKREIIVDYSGSGATAYIQGIDNIYEFDYGQKSGWVGKLNGVNLQKSAGTIKVKAGDTIEFLYTEDSMAQK